MKHAKKAKKERKVPVKDLDAKKNPKGGGGTASQDIKVTEGTSFSYGKIPWS